MEKSLTVEKPNLRTVAENIQELIEGIKGVIALQLNTVSVCDLSTYVPAQFDWEIVEDSVLNLYFDRREISVQDIREMDMFKNEKDRLVELILTCGENSQVITLLDEAEE